SRHGARSHGSKARGLSQRPRRHGLAAGKKTGPRGPGRPGRAKGGQGGQEGMTGLRIEVLVFVALITLCVAAAGYALLYNRIQKAKVVARRLQTVRRSETDRQALIVNRARAADIARRRRSVQDALKELETRQHDVDMRRKPPLKLLLRQAGLKITSRRFHVLSL